MKKKRIFRLFTIVDFEKEEEWLGRMHQNGWKFTGYRYGLFHFEECLPQDVIYRIAFKEKKLDNEYLQVFTDAGWDYVSTCLNFAYFRKEAVDFLPEDDRQITSDAMSRLDVITQFVRRRMVTALLGFAVFLFYASRVLEHGLLLSQLFILLLSVVYLCLLIWVGSGYYKLRKHSEQ